MEKIKEIQEVYAPIKEYTQDFDEVCQKLYIFETVIDQIFTIFKETIFNPEAKSLIDALNAGKEKLIKDTRQAFIKVAQENKALPPIPDLPEVISWITDLYSGILVQLFAEEYYTRVIEPSLIDIGDAIQEFAQESEESIEIEETQQEIE